LKQAALFVGLILFVNAISLARESPARCWAIYLLGGNSMMRILISAVALAFLLTLPRPAPAQDLASQLVGVWSLNSQVRKEVATGATQNNLGEKPTGHLIYTRGGFLRLPLSEPTARLPPVPI
jgi:hypothetical protein